MRSYLSPATVMCCLMCFSWRCCRWCKVGRKFWKNSLSHSRRSRKWRWFTIIPFVSTIESQKSVAGGSSEHFQCYWL